MTRDEFEELVIETQKEYCLFCNKRPCESDKCTIEKFCSNDNCSGVECGTVFAAFKFGVFDPDKIKEIYKKFDTYCMRHDCVSAYCNLQDYRESRVFEFEINEKYGKEEIYIDCSLMFTIAYLNDCLDIILEKEYRY